MSGQIIPINAVKRPEATATTSAGDTVTVSHAEAMQAELLGHSTEYIVSDTEFKVTLAHTRSMPERRLDAFVVVNDGGYPFLLGFARRSFGVEVVHNTYINPLLEQDLKTIRSVSVKEIASEEAREYTVPLLHSFE